MIIKDPKFDDLSIALKREIENIGRVKRLSYGKFKGFRIEFYSPSNSSRDEVIIIFKNHGIEPTRWAEHAIREKRYINIHEVETIT